MVWERPAVKVGEKFWTFAGVAFALAIQMLLPPFGYPWGGPASLHVAYVPLFAWLAWMNFDNAEKLNLPRWTALCACFVAGWMTCTAWVHVGVLIWR